MTQIQATMISVGIALCPGIAPAQAQARQERFEYSEVHMTMPVRIVVYAGDEAVARRAARAALDRVAQLEATLSDYRPQSELKRLEGSAGAWTPVSADLFDVLGRAVELARITGGAFDPTGAPIVNVWREARRSGVMPSERALDSARALVGWGRVRLDSALSAAFIEAGTKLDLGGIAKGFILARALDAARAEGVSRALMEAGGDIVVGDAPPGQTGWHIEVPGASAAFAARAGELVNAALATSGPEAQNVMIDGVRYSHVVDPRTGRALANEITARVISTDAATADALATTLTIIGEDAGAALLRLFPASVGEVRRTGRARRNDPTPAPAG
jgi:thiamine biosynthesis lipoprotein